MTKCTGLMIKSGQLLKDNLKNVVDFIPVSLTVLGVGCNFRGK